MVAVGDGEKSTQEPRQPRMVDGDPVNERVVK